MRGGGPWRTRRYGIGRTFPVFTDYLGATVGGTLSLGGVGSRTWQLGAQTDHVLELEVVTAAGEVVRCSPREHPDLFDAVRCGLGQFGIITSARLRLVAAPSRAHYHRALYGDFDTFFATLNALIDEGGVRLRPGLRARQRPAVDRRSHRPGRGRLRRALRAPDHGSSASRRSGCSTRASDLTATAPAAAGLAARRPLPGGPAVPRLPRPSRPGGGDADRAGPVAAAAPMLDLILPGSAAPPSSATMLESVDPADVAGPVLIYPYRRESLQTPFFRAPDEPRVVLVGLMRTTVPPSPEHVQAQLDENRRLYESAVGARRLLLPGRLGSHGRGRLAAAVRRPVGGRRRSEATLRSASPAEPWPVRLSLTGNVAGPPPWPFDKL